MKMAKASKDDIQRCILFFQFVEEYFEEGTHTPSDTDEPERLTESDFVDRLREMWGGRWKPPGVDCAWGRVVFGCNILIDNVCDPAKDVLELRPDLASAAAESAARLKSELAAAKAENERLREALDFKTRVIADFKEMAKARTWPETEQALEIAGRKYASDGKFEQAIVMLYDWARVWHKQAGGYLASDTMVLLLRVERYIHEMIDHNKTLECFRPK